MKKNFNRSVSTSMAIRFKRRHLWRRFISVTFIISYILYLSWRLTVIYEDSLLISIVFYIAEFIGFLLSLNVIANSWTYNDREIKESDSDLSVDVLIPVYQEPIHIIRKTILAAIRIDYKHKTYVLDDGKREEIKSIARELGAIYIRRDVNNHAKAGNLNHALTLIDGDFLFVLDADHIAFPESLDKMLGHFKDPTVGLVQTPQDYYNIDAFQYFDTKSNRGLWHDQSFFYNISQPCRDTYFGASCVGTGVIYRRSAIEEIGGFPIISVTEDIHTSLLMSKKDYKNIYINNSVAYGVAATDLEEYYKTRHRWAHGNLHTLTHEKVLSTKDLDLKQKFSYFSLGIIYLEGWQQLIIFLLPVLVLFLGLPPFTITIENIAIITLFPIYSYFMMQEIGCGFTRFWTNEIFAMARWPIHIISSLGAFKLKIPWKSSAKNQKGRVSLKLMMPQIMIFILTLAAVVYSFVKIGFKFESGPIISYFFGGAQSASNNLIASDTVLGTGYTSDLVLVAGLWASFTLFKSVYFFRKIYFDAKNSRNYYRFTIPFPVLNTSNEVISSTTTINEEAFCFHRAADDNWELGETRQFKLLLPTGTFELTVRSIIVREHDVVVKIIWQDNKQMDNYHLSLYSVDWHRELQKRNEYFKTPSDQIVSLFGLLDRKKKKQLSYNVISYEQDGSLQLGYLIKFKESGEYFFEILCFTPLTDVSNIFIHNKTNIESKVISNITRIELNSILALGLDGTSNYKYKVTI